MPEPGPTQPGGRDDPVEASEPCPTQPGPTQPGPTQPGWRDDPVDLGATLRVAWRVVRDNPGPALLAPLLALGCVLLLAGLLVAPLIVWGILGGLGGKGPGAGPAPPPALFLNLFPSLLTTVLLPVGVWLFLGLVGIFLQLARRRPVRLGDLFAQRRVLLPALVAYLLAVTAQNVGTLAFLVGGLAVQVALFFAPYFILDRGLGPIAALRASWESVWGLRTLLKLFAVGLLAQLGTALTCGLGAVVFFPWALAAATRLYLLLSARLPCLHCGQRLAPRTEVCPRCGEAPRELPPPPPDAAPLDLTFAGQPQPAWVLPVALLLLLPLLSQGGSPWGAAFTTAGIAPALFGVHWLVGLGAGLGAVCVPLLAALGLLLHHDARAAEVRLDEAGAWIGARERWPGSRIPWRSVRGFRRLGQGRLRLVVRRRPWTRWFGPVVPCEGREAHDVVVALEARGVYDIEGRS